MVKKTGMQKAKKAPKIFDKEANKTRKDKLPLERSDIAKSPKPKMPKY